MRKNTNLFWSAYNPNHMEVKGNYGPLFYGITALVNPQVAVEIGVCQGYSSIFIAQAIKDCDDGGILKCYDLWQDDESKTNFTEKQKGKHLTSQDFLFTNMLYEQDLEDHVEVYTQEAFNVLPNFEADSVDMIHLDIGNCGDVLNKILPEVLRTLKIGGYFLFEGGSPWRDKVDWMLEHDKAPISDLFGNYDFSRRFERLTFYEACSLTVCRRYK